VTKSVVSESALRELLREALSNTDAMSHDAPEPAITPNPAMDRTSLELDLNPIEIRHAPRSKNELIVMVRNLLDTVDDEQSGELYKKIKSLVGGDEVGKKDFGKARELPSSTDATNTRSTDMTDKKIGESMNLADVVRDIVTEALPSNDDDDDDDWFTKDDYEDRFATLPGKTEKPVKNLGEAIRQIAGEALEEAKKKKGNPFAFGGGKFKANQFKKKGTKTKNESDGDKPFPGKATKHNPSSFGGGSLAEAIRDIAAEALAEAPVRINPRDVASQAGGISRQRPDGSTPLPGDRNAAARDVHKMRAARATDSSGSAHDAVSKMADAAGASRVAGRNATKRDNIRGVDEMDEFDEMDELDEANYDAAMTEADGDHKLPFGFGKGKFMGSGGFDTSRPEDDDFEGPPSKTFAALGGSSDDDFRADGSLNFDPNEDIIDDEEKQTYLDSLSKNTDWDPEESDDDDNDAPKGKKGSPKPRIDIGTGYGVDGETYEKISEKLGFTPEGAKKAVGIALERFKILHDMDPNDLAELVMTGVDDYIQMLTKTGELDAGDIKYLHDNADVVAYSDEFRDFFSKFVKRAVRAYRADTQDDSDD